MCTLRKPIGLTIIAGLTLLGIPPSKARAQPAMMFRGNSSFQVARSIALQQAAMNAAGGGLAFSGVFPFAPSFSPFAASAFTYPGLATGGAYSLNPYANPYSALSANLYGTSPYLSAGYGLGTGSAYGSGYGSGYGDPLSGYLRGTADIINSEGRSQVSVQQADLMHEQVRRERLENRRRAFDLGLYERDRTPTPEDERQKALKEQLQRSRNDPPVGEIISATALNILLADVQKKGDNAQEPAIPLDPDVLRHINIKSPSGRGNPGLLKDAGRCRWPLVFHGLPYQAERDALSDLTPRAYEQVVHGEVAAGLLNSLTEAVHRLQEKLRDHVKELTPAEYSEGRRFLSAYQDALTLLRQPGAGDYFTRKAPRGQTIADLVRHMTREGLVFAPAVPGDEAAYRALHRALAVYDVADAGKQLAAKP